MSKLKFDLSKFEWVDNKLLIDKFCLINVKHCTIYKNINVIGVFINGDLQPKKFGVLEIDKAKQYALECCEKMLRKDLDKLKAGKYPTIGMANYGTGGL